MWASYVGAQARVQGSSRSHFVGRFTPTAPRTLSAGLILVSAHREGAIVHATEETPRGTPFRPTTAREQAPKLRRVSSGTPGRPTHDARGKFARGNGLGGRPKGAKDKAFARVGPFSIKGIYTAALSPEVHREQATKSIRAAIKQGGMVGARYLELGAKVLDKAEEVTGKHVHVYLHTNVDFTKLDEAARKNGMVPPLAGRPVMDEPSPRGRRTAR